MLYQINCQMGRNTHASLIWQKCDMELCTAKELDKNRNGTSPKISIQWMTRKYHARPTKWVISDISLYRHVAENLLTRNSLVLRDTLYAADWNAGTCAPKYVSVSIPRCSCFLTARHFSRGSSEYHYALAFSLPGIYSSCDASHLSVASLHNDLSLSRKQGLFKQSYLHDASRG